MQGPEYISHKLKDWAERRDIALRHIQPGKPQQNAYIERYNRTVRHEWLGQYIFRNIEEVNTTATTWLWTYNNERPNMGLGGITPIQKLQRLTPLKPPREFYAKVPSNSGGLPALLFLSQL